MKPQRVYVTGLPRSGSTLLCQLLAQHPDIESDGMTSPLFGMLEGLRQHLAHNDSFLSRLDSEFDLNYSRAGNVYRGILSGWLDGHHDKPFVVDKSRGWLRSIELLSHLDPDFKMIVCIRELGQLLGSVEAAHKKTILLGYRDGMSHHSGDVRATQVFNESGVIGSPLKALLDYRNEIKDSAITDMVYFVAYEALISQPIETMHSIYRFIEAEPCEIDPESLIVFPRESDSHYGMKWPHVTHTKIMPMRQREVPQEIQETLVNRYSWYYRDYYPNFLL